MPGIHVNFSDVPQFEPLPSGAYFCRVVKAEVKESKTGDFQNINWEFEVLEGDFTGRKVFSTTTLKTSGLFKLQELLMAIGEECAGKELDLDLDEYIGREVILELEMAQYQGKPSNNVKSFQPI